MATDHIGLDLDAIQGNYPPIKFNGKKYAVHDISHNTYVEMIAFVNTEIDNIKNLNKRECIDAHKKRMINLIKEAVPSMKEETISKLTTMQLISFVGYMMNEFYKSIGSGVDEAKEDAEEARKKLDSNMESESTEQK